MSERLNGRKRVIEKQNYENYWKSTLALTNFFGDQFIRTLKMIIEHIDKYELESKTDYELIKNLHASKKQFNQEVTHSKELEDTIFSVFTTDSTDGSSTRKQINTFIKLGFVKPYLKGYVPAAKEYVKDTCTREERERLFSDTVYQYASFNSSQTNDDSNTNQIKFLINTLLNKPDKKLEMDELLGVMQMDVTNSPYANTKQILQNKNWADHTDFFERKYNQVGHLKQVLSVMDLFEIINIENKKFIICLSKDAVNFISEKGNTSRDTYRFGVMKKAVIQESIDLYGGKVSWLSKEKSKGMVVSHIYSSADALREWDLDSAYDPNNALYLKPGNEDQYFDKYQMTFDRNGIPYFSDDVDEDFVEEAVSNNYRIDKKVLNPQRINYLEKYHQQKFKGEIS